VEDEDTYQPLGQDVSDAEDVAAAVTSAERDEAHFEAVFERFHDVPASSFQGVEPMALEEGAQPSTTPGSSHRCNYEDLVQEYVESTTKRAAVYANDTDLSKRVLEWERKIVPTLDEEETHPVFDIHQCGTKVIDTFKDNDSSVLDFHQLAVGKEHYEICRYFAATLQLANDGNVEIASEETMDVIGLRLLSTHRNFENVSSYGPSSSH
jgi:condensin-2 complex subunit H2